MTARSHLAEKNSSEAVAPGPRKHPTPILSFPDQLFQLGGIFQLRRVWIVFNPWGLGG